MSSRSVEGTDDKCWVVSKLWKKKGRLKRDRKSQVLLIHMFPTPQTLSHTTEKSHHYHKASQAKGLTYRL